MTEENGDTGVVRGRCSPAPVRHRPNLDVPDDCDEPPEGDWPIDVLDDWPFDDPSVDVARLRESEADIAAGRTFGEDEIRTRYGCENEVEVIRTEAEPDPDDLDVGYSQLAAEFNSETTNGERRAARDRYAGRTGEP